MQAFLFDIPTQITFGRGTVDKLSQIASQYGQTVLLVTTPAFPAVEPLYQRVKKNLQEVGLRVFHFDGVIPNPTTEVITEGANLAKACGAQVIVGLGGGSSMDAAKAIAVEASHSGVAWDYLHYKTPPTDQTLPVIAVSTTSGTGSQVTQCAVITKTDVQDKSAIWHRNIFPKAAIVDPELMLTLPPEITAPTGFDAFAHCFEAYLSVGTNPIVESLALTGIANVIEALPIALKAPGDISAREKLALADTLGGLCISSAGVTLPHGLGMQISGHCPQIAHGLSLALSYPEFTRFTKNAAPAKFAAVGRLFDPALQNKSDAEAADACCDLIDRFLKDIGLWTGFGALGISRDVVQEIADCGQVLGDYKNNPRVATLSEMAELLLAGYDRK